MLPTKALSNKLLRMTTHTQNLPTRYSSSEGVNLIFEDNKLLLKRDSDKFLPKFIISKEPIE